MRTTLQEVLMQLGVGERRAAAFERVLDDRPICGITGAGLGFLLRRFKNLCEENHEAHRAAQRRLAQMEIERFLPLIEPAERYSMDLSNTPRRGRR